MRTVSIFPVTSSILSADALKEWLSSSYDIGPILACTLFYVGLNDTYMVQTTRSNYVLRVYRAGWRTRADILFEVDMLNHLKAKGLPISTPLAKKDTRFLTSFEAPEGERFLVLFTFAPGQGLQRPPTAEQYFLYGSLQGRMHNAWDDFSSQHVRFQLDMTHLIDAPLEPILANVAKRSSDRAYLQDLAQTLREQVQCLARTGLDYGVCHGDLGGGNAHIDDNQTVTFFDFDNGGLGWRAFDVAGFGWAKRWYNVDEAVWQAFLRGYTEQRHLQDIDVLALPIFVTVRHFYILGLQASYAAYTGAAFINSEYVDRHLAFLKSSTEWWGEPA